MRPQPHRFLCALLLLTAYTSAFAEETESDAAVSYFRDVRPIFQRNCHGCHQPAKAGGEYVMTDFARLLAGGERGETAVVAGEIDKSGLLAMIEPKDGKSAMPKNAKPLADSDIEAIRQWIGQGAKK